jgi:sugar lactone lactonase YvrE
MFFADSRGPWIDRWAFNRWTGEISRRTRLATLDEASGRPDGGACDAAGTYWSAGVSASRLNRFSLDGRLLEWRPVPVPAPTMPCFGGREFRTLFLTSLRDGRSNEAINAAPQSGGLFAAETTVAGFAPWRFLDI